MPNHRDEHQMCDRNVSDAKPRQAFMVTDGPHPLSNLSSPRASQQLPVKVNRTRSASSSVEAPLPISPPARKRTSSGTFEIEECEPPPKKAELIRSLSDTPKKKSEVVANGRQTHTDNEINKKNENAMEKKEQKKESKKSKAVEKFDKEAKSNCVSVFKESDSWD